MYKKKLQNAEVQLASDKEKNTTAKSTWQSVKGRSQNGNKVDSKSVVQIKT